MKKILSIGILSILMACNGTDTPDKDPDIETPHVNSGIAPHYRLQDRQGGKGP